jgi:hypothetical protein
VHFAELNQLSYLIAAAIEIHPRGQDVVAEKIIPFATKSLCWTGVIAWT